MPSNVKYNYYLIAHSGNQHDPTVLPAPVVVATITLDPRFLGNLNPHKELEVLAGKMLLVDFEITSAEAADLPGHQLGLPFPAPKPTIRRVR